MEFLKFELWLIDLIYGRRIDRQARQHLAGVANAQIQATRERAVTLLRTMAQEAGPHVLLGETDWQEPCGCRFNTSSAPMQSLLAEPGPANR